MCLEKLSSIILELDSIILELHRIASQRRFMRYGILDAADQLDRVVDLLHVPDRLAPFMKFLVDDYLKKAPLPLYIVIRSRKFMRRQLLEVCSRIDAVIRIVCDADED